jgi:hypothetical protein
MKVRVRVFGMLLALTLVTAFSLEMRAGGQAAGGARQSGAMITGKVYMFEKITDGVY